MAQMTRTGVSEKVDNSTTVTTSTAEVMVAKDLSRLTAFAVHAVNAGAVNLNSFVLEARPDSDNDAYWVTVDNTTLATLAAGAAGRISVTANAGHTYRAHASVAADTTTLDIWITGG